MQGHILDTCENQCTGCSACRAACSAGAITMTLNAEGFYAPQINGELCTGCGKCSRACPVGKPCPNERISSYYGSHTDPDVLYGSTSGGAFRAFADTVLAENGIVYGAVYSADLTEVLFSDSDAADVSAFQKSKYIVSNPQLVYREIKEQLDTGRTVLFSGAPCQAAGLVCFLGKPYDNLITVDFVCGGMPSLRFWQEHKKAMEKKAGAAMSRVDFRSKKHGWGKGYLEIRFQNGKEYFTRDFLDSYYHCFCDEHLSVRESCLDCAFRDRHFSDVTIADFWGYTAAGVTETRGGVSLLMANSEKGEALIRRADAFRLVPLDNRFSAYALKKAAPTEDERKSRADFFAAAQKIGFEKAAKKLCPATVTAHTKKYVLTKLGIK